MLGEFESLLEVVELFCGELEPADERLDIFFIVQFFSEEEREIMEKE